MTTREVLVPELATISITVAVAPQAAAGLHAFVQKRMSRANSAVEDSAEAAALGAELERVEETDPEFGRKLRKRWAAAGEERPRTGDTYVNKITGPVSGTVIQVGRVHGDINDHRGR